MEQNEKLMTHEDTKTVARNLYEVLCMETNNDTYQRGVVLMTMLSVFMCECAAARKPGVKSEKLVRDFMAILERDAINLIDKFTKKHIKQEEK